jgi:hypothetical protein
MLAITPHGEYQTRNKKLTKKSSFSDVNLNAMTNGTDCGETFAASDIHDFRNPAINGGV